MKKEHLYDEKVYAHFFERGFTKSEAVNSATLHQRLNNLNSCLQSMASKFRVYKDDSIEINLSALNHVRELYEQFDKTFAEYLTSTSRPILRQLKSLFHELGCDL